MAESASKSFFDALRRDEAAFDGERLLYEVDARFDSPDLLQEVRWRLQVLNELADQHRMSNEFEALRDALTRIFSEAGNEQVVLARIRDLTHVQTPDGRRVDMRRFLVGQGQVYDEHQYRRRLSRKVANTADQVVNLVAFYPGEEPVLRRLGVVLKGLVERMQRTDVRTLAIKRMEDRIRDTQEFKQYETLKVRMLRDWLGRYAHLPEQELQGLDDAEIQRLIQAHQRHQMTQLLQSNVRLLDEDVSERLGLHDTLEAEFRNEAFWQRANVNARRGFVDWVLDVVRAFGIPQDRRYAFFRSEQDKSLHLLFGLGLPRMPELGEEPIRMVPYVKPFTRKSGYLLEIKRRSLGNEADYHHELLHYTLPFLFGFDRMPDFKVRDDLRTFFNSRY